MAVTELRAIQGGRDGRPGNRRAPTADPSDTASRPAVSFTAAIASVTGPRASNHDSGTAGQNLLAVADGVGGGTGGGLASVIAVNRMVAGLPVPEDAAVGPWLRHAVADINRHLGSARLRRALLRSLSTTLTTVALAPSGELAVAHIGSSRAYLLHGTRLVQLTTDHGRVPAALDSVASGLSRAHVRADHHAELAALQGRIDDLNLVEEGSLRVGVGDRVLVCTDGLHSALPHGRITDILVRHRSAADAVSALMRALRVTSRQDDATAAVADVVAGSGVPRDPVRRVGAAVRLGVVPAGRDQLAYGGPAGRSAAPRDVRRSQPCPG